MKKLKIGIIGCGKVTELGHLPASKKVSSVEIDTLVDINEQQVSSLAEKYNIPHHTNSIEDIYDRVDAVVVAVPNHLHAPVSIEFLKRGIHVLVEKPMALTVDECDKMIEAAESTGSVLSVGMIRRQYPLFKYVNYILEANIIGDITSFDFSEGYVSKWDVISDYRFKKERGGGVMAATGSHTLDTLVWWLGDVKNIEYYDDSKGGVEANSLLNVMLTNKVQGTVEISTDRDLRNTYKIYGTDGTLECEIDPCGPLKIKQDSNEFVLPVVNDEDHPNFKFVSAFEKQYKIFYDSIVYDFDKHIKGYDGKKTVKIIQDCLSKKNSISYPWQV